MPQQRQQQMMDAIAVGSVEELRIALDERNPEDGVPSANVNQVRGNCTALHAILFTGHLPVVKRQMVQLILDLRDNNGNVVADLNRVHPNAGAVLTAAIENNDVQLLQQILDVRNRDGALAVNVLAAGPHGGFWSPMTRALFRNRLEVVQWLVDARQPNGAPLFSPEDLRDALAGAHGTGGVRPDNNNATRWMRQHLLAMGLTPPELQPNLYDRALPQEPERAAVAFANESQNTHRPVVLISVEASFNRLKNRYGTKQNIQQALTFIRSHICQGDYSQGVKRFALRCLDRIERTTEIRMGIDLTQAQALALVWQACNDRDTVVEGVTAPLSDSDIAHRMHTMVNHLVLAQTTYGPNDPACFVGTFNKIAEILDRVHPDVIIVTGGANLMSIATERARVIVRDQLNQKKRQKQRSILKSWGEEDEQSAAHQFRVEAKSVAQTLLKDEFQTLLDEAQRNGIIESLGDLPRPHSQLNALVDEIENMPINGCDAKKTLVKELHEQALAVYDHQDFDSPVRYQALRNKREVFLEVERAERCCDKILEYYRGKNLAHKEEVICLKRTISDLYQDVGLDPISCSIHLHNKIDAVIADIKRKDKANSPHSFFGVNSEMVAAFNQALEQYPVLGPSSPEESSLVSGNSR